MSKTHDDQGRMRQVCPQCGDFEQQEFVTVVPDNPSPTDLTTETPEPCRIEIWHCPRSSHDAGGPCRGGSHSHRIYDE